MTESIKKGILYGFVIISLIFFTWWLFNLYNTFWGTTAVVEVPNITSMPLHDAEKALKKKHLNMLVSDSRYDNTVPENVVITQEPLPGAKVRKGRDIMIIVSSGPDLCEVPKVTGLTVRESQIMLSNYKLELGKTDKAQDNTVSQECIFKQDPLSGSKVKKGTKVDVVINSGGAPDIKAPKLAGQNIKDVRDKLDSLKLRVGEIKWEYSDEKDLGEILWQSLDEGTLVYPYTDISFKVSAGSRYIDLKLKQDNIIFTAPASSKKMDIKIVLTDLTGAQAVYAGTQGSGDKINLFVTSMGPAEVVIYIDEKVVKRAAL